MNLFFQPSRLCSNSCLRNKPPKSYDYGGFSFIVPSFVPKNHFVLSDNPYPYKEAKLIIGKRLYVEYHVWSITDNKLIRKRFGNFKAKTKHARIKEAKAMVKQVNRLLAKGYVVDKNKDKRKEIEAKTERVRFYSFHEGIEFATSFKLKGESSIRTKQTYTSFLNMFGHWSATSSTAKLGIKEITPILVLKFLDWLQTDRIIKGKQRKAVGNRTYNNYLKHLQILFNTLIKRKIVEVNPCYEVDQLPVQSSRHYPYSTEQRAILEKQLKENAPELWLFTRFIYYAFLRPAELCKLSISDIDLDNRVIIVPANISKNRKQQSVPMNSNLQKIIRESKVLDNPSNYLLFSKGLRPGIKSISPRRAGEKHSQVLKDCDLYDGKLTLYSWKHTGAQNAFRNGGLDIMDLKEMLRHHALDMTYVYLQSLGLNINKRINDKEW